VPSIDPERLEDSPAVVNLLVNGGRPSGDALAATVVDLAARGHLDLEQVAPQRSVCRLSRHGPAPDGLEPHERRVLDLLTRRADGDGFVPTEALARGTETEAADWWDSFCSEVVDTGRTRQYFAERIGIVLFLVVTAGIALLALALGTVAAAIGTLAGLGMMLLLVGGGYFVGDLSELVVLDRAGRRSARYWRSIGEECSRAVSLHGASPGGVSTWGRRLAYATALGEAPAVSRALPLGPESPTSVWRRAAVRYPRHLPPGTGRHPAIAALIGGTVVAAATWILVVVLEPGRWHPSPPLGSDLASLLGWAEPFLAGVAAVALLLGAWELIAALLDLRGEPHTVGGVVVGRWIRVGRRVNPWGDLVPRHRYLAVDSGSGTMIRGWRVRSHLFDGVEEGDAVTVRVTPRLGYVSSLRRLGAAPERR
jgi:hypothetical protein